MKKIVLLSLVVMCSLSVSAQGFRFGATGGYSLSKASHSNSIDGFHVGAKVEYGLKKNYYLTSGLLLTNKWTDGAVAIRPLGSDWLTYQYEAKPLYLELPIHIGRKYALSKKVKAFVDGGIYMAWGLSGSGNAVGITMIRPGTYAQDYKYDNVFSDGDQRRFDCGVGFNAGAELFKHYQVSLGYDHGTRKVGGFASFRKNRTMKLSFAYMF